MKFSRYLIVIFSLFAWCAPSGAAAAPVIMVFGDSLSSGYGLPLERGWVSLLDRRLQEREPGRYRVVNASLSGETTLGGARRIEAALKTHRPSIVIVELGGNDGLRGLSLDATRRNLETIIKTCRRYKAEVLLAGMRLPPNYGIAYTRKFQEIYADLARRHTLRRVHFLLEGIGENREWFQPDGIHPTAEAQPLILENVWKPLQPMLKPSRTRP